MRIGWTVALALLGSLVDAGTAKAACTNISNIKPAMDALRACVETAEAGTQKCTPKQTDRIVRELDRASKAANCAADYPTAKKEYDDLLARVDAANKKMDQTRAADPNGLSFDPDAPKCNALQSAQDVLLVVRDCLPKGKPSDPPQCEPKYEGRYASDLVRQADNVLEMIEKARGDRGGCDLTVLEAMRKDAEKARLAALKTGPEPNGELLAALKAAGPLMKECVAFGASGAKGPVMPTRDKRVTQPQGSNTLDYTAGQPDLWKKNAGRFLGDLPNLRGDEMLKACAALDYPALAKKIEAERADWPRSELIPTVDNWAKAFDAAIDGYYLGEMDRLVGFALGQPNGQATFYPTALLAVGQAEKLIDAVLAVRPENAKVKGAKGGIAKVRETAQKNLEEKYYYGAFHLANMNKIVFSKKPIDLRKPESLVTEFKGGDTIYAAIYLDKSMLELYRTNPQGELVLPLVVNVDGKDGQDRDGNAMSASFVRGEAMKQTAYVVEIVPEAGATQMEAIERSDILIDAGAGKHTVKISLKDCGINGCTEGIAASFTLDTAKPKDIDELAAKFRKKLLADVKLPAKGGLHKKVSGDVLKVAKKEWQKLEAKLVVVTSDDYSYEKNALGVVTARKVNFVVGLESKKRPGRCYISGATNIEQAVGSKWSEMSLSGVNAGGGSEILCSNMK